MDTNLAYDPHNRKTFNDINNMHTVKGNSVKKIIIMLTLKTPRKPASENVVCLCHLLNILAKFSNLFFCIPANSVDPDQTGAV